MGETKRDRKEREKARHRAQARRNKDFRKWKKRISTDLKDRDVRAKYGSSQRSAPVIVKSVETGEVLDVRSTASFKRGS
jgi:hypothetical protein